MNIWKIDYANQDDQNAVCCTVVARGNTKEEALQLAGDYAKHYPLHSNSPHVKSCGLVSDGEAQGLLDEGENVRLIMYISPNSNAD